MFALSRWLDSHIKERSVHFWCWRLSSSSQYPNSLMVNVVVSAIVVASASVLAVSTMPTEEPGGSSSPGRAGPLAWADYDRDGLSDVYVVNQTGEDRLYRGLPDGRFEDVTVVTGLSGATDTAVARWADSDGDGAPELFLAANAGSNLYRFEADGVFISITERVGLSADMPATDASWLDYDGDGAVDLVIAAAQGEVLYHNTGGGMFEHVEFELPNTTEAGLSVVGIVRVVDDPGIGDRPGPGRPEVDPSRPGANSGGSTGGVGGVTSSPIAPPPGAPGIGITCPIGVNDFVNPAVCLPASSAPLLGYMYPLGKEFNIAPDGDIGFGTTSPFGRFHIQDDGVTNGPFLNLEATGNMTGNLDMIQLTMPAASQAQFIECETSGKNVMWVDVDGTVVTSRVNLDFDLNLYGGPYDAAKAKAESSIRGESGNMMVNGAGSGGDIYLNLDDGDDVHIGAPGSTESTAKLLVNGRVEAKNDGTGTGEASVRAENLNTSNGGIAIYGKTHGDDATAVFSQQGTGDILKGFSLNVNGGGSPAFQVTNTGRVVTTALQITGGGDLVEGFESSSGLIEPGTVVVIDPENPGQLKASATAQDRKVAGVISGAGGVKHGIRMGQDGVLDGENLVAMTGRVYVKCTAKNGAIEPGDLLTTSPIEGHAMRVTDPIQCSGAMLGKAMTGLDAGTGLVLVLVNLQ